LASVLLSDTETGLSVLPLGNSTNPASRNPVSQEVAQKLSDPAHGFDLVIIDSGAVLTDDSARPFADLADDIVFAVRAGGRRETKSLRHSTRCASMRARSAAPC